MAFAAEPLPSGDAGALARSVRPVQKRRLPHAKVVFDKSFAALALFTLAPVMALIALATRLGDPGPVFYRQSRIGKDGATFECLKFRSMRVDSAEVLAELLAQDPVARADWARDQKLTNDPRIHPVGRVLRKTSLDELPQFWNVLMGEMSIVGPRPIIAEEAERYGSHFADYCAVRPGITGAWQVGGRNSTSYEERVALDVAYVRNASFADDLKIIMQTIRVVVTQEGAS